MPSDISRSSDDGRHDYQGVVMQQGRVILDRDFNALQETVERRIDADALDFVGPYGTPDDGFKIDAPLPPSRLVTDSLLGFSPPIPNDRDFSISPGTMYIGGQRAVFRPAAFGESAVQYSYSNQPDWLHPDLPNPNAMQEFISLHLCEQDVSAVEDPDLKDVALGGPDTTQRIRLMKRVKRLPVRTDECAEALEQASVRWRQQGFRFDAPTMRLLPQATLKVGFADIASVPNPCDPVARGGYLGAENQLIRVQITDAGDSRNPKLLWGYDNASFIYRATVSNSTTLLLGQSPVDAFHIPQQGQVVEVLRSALIIDSTPNVTEPTKPPIVRCVAEATGFVCALAETYVPDNRSITLDRALPPEYQKDTNPLFVRIWQSEANLNSRGDSVIELIDTAGNNTTGIVVTIDLPEVPPVGAYWIFAVRPSTPQAVYPERFLAAPQPPDGPRQWVCPLAVIDWTNAPVFPPHDCREQFDNLVELTKRKLVEGGCCTITITPEKFSKNPDILQDSFDRLADMLDSLKLTGAELAKICLRPGTYSLHKPLILGKRHSGIALEGCPGGVTIQTLSRAEPFLHGLIWVSRMEGLKIRGIRFMLPVVDFLSGGLLAGLDPRRFLPGRILSSIGIRIHQSREVSIVDCEFDFGLPKRDLTSLDSERPFENISRFGAGILITGRSDGLAVTGCRFHDDLAHGPDAILWVLLGIVATAAETLASINIERPSAGPIGTFLPAVVRHATVTENVFNGLTAATLFLAYNGRMRVENNTVSGCYAGFHLGSPHFAALFGDFATILRSTSRSTAIAAVTVPIITATLDPVFTIGSVLARAYPLPSGRLGPTFDNPTLDAFEVKSVKLPKDKIVSRTLNSLKSHFDLRRIGPLRAREVGRAEAALPFTEELQQLQRLFEFLENRALREFEKAADRLIFSLHFTGNDVDCGLARANRDEKIFGPALVILGDPGKEEGDAKIPDKNTAILTSNRLSSSPHDERGARSTVVVAMVDRVTISGNVIANETTLDRDPFCLVVYPIPHSKLAMIAITGNVLQGFRIVPNHSPVWDELNAVAP